MTVWVDVEDLFDYLLIGKRPSGIQRFAFEMCRALSAEPGVRFCRHQPLAGGLQQVAWSDVEQLYERLGAGQAEAAPAGRSGFDVLAAHAARPPEGPGERGLIKRSLGRLPGTVRFPLMRTVLSQAAAAKHGVESARAIAGLVAGFAHDRLRPAARRTQGEAIAPAPGDVLLVPGAPWSRPEYGQMLAGLKQRHGLRVALVVYDLIAILHPEWFDPGLVRVFGSWLRATLPHCDWALAISRATAADLTEWLAREGLAAATRVETIPVGTGFGAIPPLPPAVAPPPADPGYVLFVSTLEARKNHTLAFRAWRRLMREMPEAQVPRLVFAGQVGWLVADLMQQIENSAHLGGKLVLVRGGSDAELRLLYRDCRFTLFPSFYEGWGLPVTESLSFGRACIASDRASVPEAGGPFCLYLDPDNVTGATALIRRAIEQPQEIAALERRIREEFRPTPWSAAARAILDLTAHPGER
ncbi:glycosyltransferase family 4 protein [Roseomonas sp. OT10]|uniref:glycosyltransferase family 4 protein n=1 Tax=Roseomonas cutis TaxID=2897332 RepID=UPI001E4464AE|nr:glycosyltransferase family 1 protein [Roseomonas sp. OT10]UFN48342.1 glycosyltransferase family 4 protein [Roseomonas sp. OT10]